MTYFLLLAFRAHPFGGGLSKENEEPALHEGPSSCSSSPRPAPAPNARWPVGCGLSASPPPPPGDLRKASDLITAEERACCFSHRSWLPVHQGFEFIP